MASVPGLNANFDNLMTETINVWQSNTYANAYTANHPFWASLLRNGNMVRTGVGYAWYEPFMYPTSIGPMPTGVSDGFQEVADATEQGGKTMAAWTPAQYAMQVAVENYDIEAQGSETKMVDHIKETFEMANIRYFETYANDLWAAEGAFGSDGQAKTKIGSLRTYLNGGGTSNGPNAAVIPQPNTEQTLAAVGTTPKTTVGGIVRTAENGAYWCPNMYNPASAATPTLTLFNRMYTIACRTGGDYGTDSPDLILLPNILYDWFMTTLQQQQRWQGNGQLAQMGFADSFKFRGADVMFDDGVPHSTNANQAFFINTRYFKLRYNTMQPQYTLAPIYNKLVRNWMSSQILQLTAKHLGRVHSRHCKIADPA